MIKIETIRLKNFKSFKELELTNLPNLAVFVGANGTGKSTLFDVFGFLSDALRNNVRQALQLRGGFREVRSRGSNGFIEIELQFRLMIANRSRLVTYHLEIGEQNHQIYIQQEFLRYKRGRFGSPYYFLRFSKGEGWDSLNGLKRQALLEIL